MNIHDLFQKCKATSLRATSTARNVAISKETLFPIIIILVAFGSFGLGRLSISKENYAPIKIEYDDMLMSQAAAPAFAERASGEDEKQRVPEPQIGGALVGSKNGSVYHLPWCSGAKRIKEENKIWFENDKQAKDAGYRPAENCPGL
ncbi:MAG: Ada metal-binding domain-containing protein [bacterium]|nr:Ada metal-binding domain-containing protein [bacterium]